MGFVYERIFPENRERCGRCERIGTWVLLCWKEREMFLWNEMEEEKWGIKWEVG